VNDEVASRSRAALLGRQTARSSFLKKTSKRLLFLRRVRQPGQIRQVKKFFGSFFQKRTFFLTLNAITKRFLTAAP
jgi:hypothetical protein